MTASTVTQISPVVTGTTSRRRIVGVLRMLLPPFVFGVAFLALWQWFVTARDIAPYVLPAPSDIWSAFWDDHALIVAAAESTGANALVGLVVGTVLAVLAAALAVRVRIADEMITPLAAAAATMPIVALAPIFNNMFSLTSTLPRRMVVVVTVFVPVFMNVARGLKRIAPVHAELMASYAAGGAAVLRTIRVPGALPYFFVGLRIAASLSVIAAVVAEYFGGLQRGLGPRITSAVAASDYASAWAFVLGAIGLGLLFYLVALAVERVALRNHT
jgi:NitT/TauT family transport system permease protein